MRRARAIVLSLVALVLGFGAGWLVRGEPPAAATQGAAQASGRPTPPLLPRRSLAEQHTVLVGEVEPLEIPEDHDGKVILRPVDPGRVLTFEAEDADAALAAVERFAAGLRADYVTERAPGRVTLRDVRVLWRVEGEGAERRLRVVVAPADAYGSEWRAARTAEAIAEWCIVNGAYAETVTSSEGQTAAVTSVRAPDVKGVMPVFDAAEAEFRARGLTLTQEDVVQDAVVALARDVAGALLWSFAWRGDQARGTFGVCHHADPFDTAGEQELLLAVLRRALGRDVTIRLDALR